MDKKERIIFDENPINGKDQIAVKTGSKINWEKFTYLDFIDGTRKDRKIAYLVSTFGRIIDTSNGKEIKPKRVNKGYGLTYDYVTLYLEMGGYRTYDVNRLVALAFSKTDNDEKYARNDLYIMDGDRTNHYFKNLRWISRRERFIINTAIKSNDTIESRVRAIKILLKAGYEDADIKEFFKSVFSIKVKITEIRSIKKSISE